VAVAAIVAAELRDRRRIEHEREEKLRAERIGAYRKLLAATTTAHVEREGVAALSEAYAEIRLLATTEEIERSAGRVWTNYGNTQKVSKGSGANQQHGDSPFSGYLRRAEESRDRFVELAREELQVSRKETREEAQRPWWRRIFGA